MNNALKKPFTLDRIVRLTIALLILVGTCLLINRLSQVLLPFLLAWLLAYFIYPLLRFVQLKLKIRNRILAIVITLLTLLTVFSLVGYLLIPPIIAEIQKAIFLFNQLLANSSYSFEWPSSIVAKLQPLLENLSAQALQLENIQTLVQAILPYLLQIASGAGNIIVYVMLAGMVILYLVFILKDYESLSNDWIQLIPKHYRPFILQVTDDLKVGMNRYFRSQALIAGLVGILFVIGFSVIRLPMAILFGLMVGLMNMVPYLQTVAIIPALLLAAIKAAEYHQSFLWVAVSVLAVFALVQVIEEVFLTPRIMGKTTGLHPAVILLSLSIWGALLGVVGMILALPVTTILISYYNRFIIKEGVLEQLLLGDEMNKTSPDHSPSSSANEAGDTADS